MSLPELHSASKKRLICLGRRAAHCAKHADTVVVTHDNAGHRCVLTITKLKKKPAKLHDWLYEGAASVLTFGEFTRQRSLAKPRWLGPKTDAENMRRDFEVLNSGICHAVHHVATKFIEME